MPNLITTINRFQPTAEISAYVITRQGVRLFPPTDIIAKPFNPANEDEWYYNPRRIDLGGIISDPDWTRGARSFTDPADQPKSINHYTGHEITVVTGYDNSNANYDKITLKHKGVRGVDESRCIIKNTVSGTIYQQGFYSTAFNESSATDRLVIATYPLPYAGVNFWYSFGASGDLYISKGFIEDASSRKLLKLFYESKGRS